MFENAKAFVGKHPYASAGIFFGILLLLFLVSRGGSSATSQTTGTSGPSPAQVQAAYAYQTSQLQQQTALAGINAQVQEHADQLTAQLHAIDVGSTTTLGADSIGAALQGQLGSLSAQIAEMQSNNALEATRLNDTLSANLATIAANTTTSISNNNTATITHIIDTLHPVPTPAPLSTFQREDAYLSANQDVASYFTTHYDPSIGGVTFGTPQGGTAVFHTPEDLALDHFLTYGQAEGRTYPGTTA